MCAASTPVNRFLNNVLRVRAAGQHRKHNGEKPPLVFKRQLDEFVRTQIRHFGDSNSPQDVGESVFVALPLLTNA